MAGAAPSTWDDEEIFLTIQIPYFTHPDYMGRRGMRLQRITQETRTIIHFPDSNKRPYNEIKSNKVVIKGEYTDVAYALGILRDRQPFSYIIEYSKLEKLELQSIQRLLRCKLHEYSISIKIKIGPSNKTYFIFTSSQQFIGKFLDGMRMVKELMKSNEVSLRGCIFFDISSCHLASVMGSGDKNLTYIEYLSRAKIHYDEELDSRLWTSYLSVTFGSDVRQRESTVAISGTPETVCLAWKSLLPFLPVTLSFKVPGEPSAYEHLKKLSQRVDMKSKNGYSIVYLTGPESQITKLYAVREYILDLPSPSGALQIPKLDFSAESENHHRNEKRGQDNAIGMSEDSNESGSSGASGQNGKTGMAEKIKKRPPPLSLSPEICTNTKRVYEKDFDIKKYPQSEDIPVSPSEYRMYGAIPKNAYYMGRKEYENQRDCAKNLMENEITDKPRSPTSAWSGCLHSRSLPDISPHKLLSFDFPINQGNSSGAQSASTSNLNRNNDHEPGINPLEKNYQCSLSNYIENLTIEQKESCNVSSPRIKNLKQLLQLLDLEQYEKLFSRHNINLMTFLMLKEEDLTMLNVKHSHCMKMLKAIGVMKQPARHQITKSFNPIVGYERENPSCKGTTGGQSDEMWSTNGAKGFFT